MASKLSKTCHNVLLLGAPGVGKGTYGKKLAKYMNAAILESGRLCRRAAEEDSIVQQCVENGDLVDDSSVFQMVRKSLLECSGRKDSSNKSVLFDGFPRNVRQAKLFDQCRLGMEYPLDLAIYFYLPYDVLKLKLHGRRVCSNKQCNANYNVCDVNQGDIVMQAMFPILDRTRCDECNSPLTQRDDDKESVIENRLRVFHELNEPLVEYYEKKGIVMRYDIKKGIDDFPDILDKVERKLNALSKHRYKASSSAL